MFPMSTPQEQAGLLEARLRLGGMQYVTVRMNKVHPEVLEVWDGAAHIEAIYDGNNGLLDLNFFWKRVYGIPVASREEAADRILAEIGEQARKRELAAERARRENEQAELAQLKKQLGAGALVLPGDVVCRNPECDGTCLDLSCKGKGGGGLTMHPRACNNAILPAGAGQDLLAPGGPWYAWLPVPLALLGYLVMFLWRFL